MVRPEMVTRRRTNRRQCELKSEKKFLQLPSSPRTMYHKEEDLETWKVTEVSNKGVKSVKRQVHNGGTPPKMIGRINFIVVGDVVQGTKIRRNNNKANHQ